MMHEVKQSYSRRSFLGLGAAAALVATGLAGCSPKSPGSDEVKSGGSAADVTWDHETDVIVCGLGAAGVAAAIDAKEAGASVTVYEMASEGGGATKMSGGVVYLGGGTRVQKACGVEDSVENMKAYVKAVTTPSGGDEALVDLYCESSLPLFDWLEDHGVVFQETAELEKHQVTSDAGIGLEYSGNERGWDYIKVAAPAARGHTPNSTGTPTGGGANIFDPLETSAKDAGVEINYDSEVTSLVQDETGRIVGVKVTTDGKKIAVKALKGVLLSTGAFTMNESMVADYCPEGAAAGSKTGYQNDTGSGILMGMKVGGGLRSMGVSNIQQFLYMYGQGPVKGMFIDKYGLRFIDEGAYGSWIGRAMYHHTPEAAFLVYDSEMAKDLDPYLGSALSQDFEADTFEELAQKIGVPEKSFLDTAERYNTFAQAENDEDFHKDPLIMAPLVAPPYYATAMPVSHCTFHTLGGLKINDKAQVLDLNGKEIDGLYAAGRTACAIFGRYPGSGSSIAEALTFGRIAGQMAAAN